MSKPILAAEAELIRYRNEILKSLYGLGHIPWFGWVNPLNLLLRRRESYLLGELRAAIVLIDTLSEAIDKAKMRDKT